MNTVSINALGSRLRAYWTLMRLDKPIGIYLLLWPGLWALWIAGSGRPGAGAFLIILLGTLLMRSAGCVINDYADRGFDGHVERTRERPIVSGKVSPKEALYLFALICLLAFVLVLQANDLTKLMSIPGVVLAASYPFMKRYTHWPQLYLGVAFGWAVPMAFTAELGSIPLVGWELYLATILWALIYDTQYAMVDRNDDIRIGVKSTAILFGEYDRLIIGVLQGLMILLFVMIGREIHAVLPYYVGLGLAAATQLYQQTLIRHRERADCFAAFLNNNYFGLLVFVGLLLNYSLR